MAGAPLDGIRAVEPDREVDALAGDADAPAVRARGRDGRARREEEPQSAERRAYR